ncbi:hypothetical protein BJ165DRAFT_1397455 [Panaeolus papilionaceus]|nr:hypothetical protein BJ165DRAFT_1397455 [Panaeolus papilionaceus]
MASVPPIPTPSNNAPGSSQSSPVESPTHPLSTMFHASGSSKIMISNASSIAQTNTTTGGTVNNNYYHRLSSEETSIETQNDTANITTTGNTSNDEVDIFDCLPGLAAAQDLGLGDELERYLLTGVEDVLHHAWYEIICLFLNEFLVEGALSFLMLDRLNA